MVKKVKKSKIKINNKNKNKIKINININSHNKKKASNKQPKISNIQQQQQPSIIINNPYPVSSGIFSNEYGVGLSRSIDAIHHGMIAIKLQNDEMNQNRLNNEITNQTNRNLIENRIKKIKESKKNDIIADNTSVNSTLTSNTDNSTGFNTGYNTGYIRSDIDSFGGPLKSFDSLRLENEETTYIENQKKEEMSENTEDNVGKILYKLSIKKGRKSKNDIELYNSFKNKYPNYLELIKKEKDKKNN